MANDYDLAVVGMACRFPGAETPEEFWRNLLNGVESIAVLSDAELLAAGVPAGVLSRPDYVKAAPLLNDPAAFDAAFFGYSPGEAAVLDPQHRVLLELAQSALDDAGCDPRRFPGRIGVFAGSAMNTYFASAGLASRLAENYLPTLIASDKDFLATRISYKLGLRGPSLTVQTACSTSLVAIHLARQSLLSEESDVALVGAVSVRVPHQVGYFADGGVASTDGHIRAFDAGANGTIFGSGAGVLVLKRLADALEQGDCIRAVIKGSAINNDGALKVGYAAPSVEGQADAVVEALANSGVNADEISYVEAHGSGTPLGDPIEVRALASAFRRFTARSGYCALGSVKPNVGHLDAAAGLAGTIKTILALQHGQIPPTLHYRRPNPEIDFAATPFWVNAAAHEWPRSNSPRRAGVMATGMGGTNAHVVLEEAPERGMPAPAPGPHLLLVSAKTAGALREAEENLMRHLASEANESSPAALADLAYTLQTGRSFYSHRRFLLCGTPADGAAQLRAEASEGQRSETTTAESAPVALLLPGIGDHYAGMGRGLYRQFPAFQGEVDRCAELFLPLIGVDIRELLFPRDLPEPDPRSPRGIDLKRMLGRQSVSAAHPATVRLQQTLFGQCALFTVEYALARLWMHWGVTPTYLVGHSMGEYVAACLAGVFTLPEAVRLIAVRARLVAALPEGAMVAVMLPEAELRPLLSEELSISLINGPQLCVVAGSPSAVERLKEKLTQRKVIFRPVRNGHAFHSRLLDPMIDEFVAELKQVKFSAPCIPFVSNVSGTWITPAQATDPQYWAEHARSTARFSDALAELWRIPNCTLLEAGPGRTLGLLALQHPGKGSDRRPVVLSSLRHDYENQPDAEVVLTSLGRLWLSGASLRWEQVDPRPDRRKVPLPTYPFARTRHWIEAVDAAASGAADSKPLARAKFDNWFYVPSWQQEHFGGASCSPLRQGFEGQAQRAQSSAPDSASWLIAGESSALAHRLSEKLRSAGATVARAVADLKRGQGGVLNVIYLAGISAPNEAEPAFLDLLALTQALGEKWLDGAVRIAVVTNQVQEVTGEETLNPAMATAIGLSQVIPREYDHFITFAVDLAGAQGEPLETAVRHLCDEFRAPVSGGVIAYRGKYRWTRHFRSQALAPRQGGLRAQGVYLITGGTGGLGLVIAKHLAKACGARLVLVKKTPWPGGEPDDVLRAQLREIEHLGGSAEIQICDVCDRAAMKLMIADVVGRHGAIHGAVHAAGILRDGLIQVKTPEVVRAVLGPKVNGAAILHELLQPLPLDFFLLFSSLSSVLPFHGQGDYSAANAYLDAFAFAATPRASFRTTAIDWPVWREVGILTKMETLAGFEAMHRAVLNRAISPEEGAEVFDRAMNSPFAQIVVSPQPWTIAQTESSDPRLVDVAATSGSHTDSAAASTDALAADDQPRDEVEIALAELWGKILGVTSVGRTQNFLDLGGHSLLAMRIVAAIKNDYQVDFTLRKFFEFPTVAETAAAIRALVEADVENLTDEEVSRLSS